MTTATDTAELLLNAHDRLMAEDMAGADALLQKVFLSDPTNLRARALFSLCAAQAGDLDTAGQNAAWVLDREPGNGVAQRAMALVQRQAQASTHPTVPRSGATPLAERHSPSGLTRTAQSGPGFLRKLFFVVLGALVFPVLFVVVVNSTRDLHGGYIRESDIADVPFLFAALALVGAGIGRWAAGWGFKKTARRPRRQAPTHPVRGFFLGFVRLVLWLVLLAAGAFAGWFIASDGGQNPEIGMIGAIGGLLVSQVIQVILTRRRR